MSAFIPSSLYGVIGWPLAQSLSPLLHNTAFQALGIPAAYMLWELPPEKLPRFVDSMRLLGIRGCSVTLPHKVEILPLLDHRSERVELMGAANTLYWRDDRLCGENTDVTGFMHPLLERGLDPATPVLVLGAGGAARAVVCGLWLHGCRRIFVTTPSDRSHAPLVERFGVTAVPWAERHDVAASLLVNTTPLGMHGKAEDQSPYDFDRAPAPADGGVSVAYDIVYNPLRTLFLREAQARGWATISGLEMFFRQGEAQFRLWTGQYMPQAARLALEQGRGPSYVAALWGIKPYPAEKQVNSARRFTLGWCRKAVVRCGQVDLAMKSTGQDGQELLTGLLLELATPASPKAARRY